MFNFRKKFKEYSSYSYDMNYLNAKKNDFECYLQTKEKLYSDLCGLDQDLESFRKQIKAIENKSIGTSNPHKIEEHRKLINSMEKLFEGLIIKFIKENINSHSSPYHIIVSNIISVYKKQFMFLKAKYNELNEIEFFDIDNDINRFYNSIKQVYYSFLATEYQYGIDKNNFKR